MDKYIAIANFMGNVESLKNLPFITGAGIKLLYGKEVAAALRKMERIDREAMICQQCGSRDCCAKCEFYAPQFNQCPIHSLRPVICRFHFCDKFQIESRPDVKGLPEIFLYCVSVAAAYGSSTAKLFNPPPFAAFMAELIEGINPLVSGVKSGMLKPDEAQKRIRREVKKYRNQTRPEA